MAGIGGLDGGAGIGSPYGDVADYRDQGIAITDLEQAKKDFQLKNGRVPADEEVRDWMRQQNYRVASAELGAKRIYPADFPV